MEAKRALPKDESPVSKDQQAVANGQRTKKIFVGGLAPTVDDETFRSYFGEFGEVRIVQPALLWLGILWFANHASFFCVKAWMTCKCDFRLASLSKQRSIGPSLLHAACADLCSRGHAASCTQLHASALVLSFPPALLLQVDDAVVMYDHENKRPRGFGFITYTGTTVSGTTYCPMMPAMPAMTHFLRVQLPYS